MDQVTIAEGKNRFSSIVKKAEQTPVEITRRGKAVAVILSKGEYDRLIHGVQKPDFKSAYIRYLESVDLNQLAVEENLFQRDQSPGRDPDF